MTYCRSNNVIDKNRGQKACQVGDHVGNAHECSRVIGCDVDMVAVEAGIIESVEAHRHDQKDLDP